MNVISERSWEMNSEHIKAIIIAAGMGRRLRPYTLEVPKCMLEFSGKSLLRHQLETFMECGIHDISVVRGYRKEMINYPNLKYYENTDYENNNILNSLFYAKKEITGNVIVSYSDILFENRIVQKLASSEEDISIVVDTAWRENYVGRKDHPFAEAESVIFDANKQVVKIGKIYTEHDDVSGEFIGMMKLSPGGSESFKKYFARSKTAYWNQPFQRARSFQKAYLTDMIQEMAELGFPVHCITIERGWREIDTVEDYEKASRELSF